VNGELADVRVPAYSRWEAAGHEEPWALAFPRQKAAGPPRREATGPPREAARLTCGDDSCFG
jgi:hypothetical protein